MLRDDEAFGDGEGEWLVSDNIVGDSATGDEADGFHPKKEVSLFAPSDLSGLEIVGELRPSLTWPEGGCESPLSCNGAGRFE